MKPLVSIIIPVYNKKEYIQDCLDALLEQQYNRYEIILVDDGSTDGSSELLDRIVFENINVDIQVYHQKNQGVSVARNKGLELAKGEWIWFVDSDDIPNSTWLSEISTYFESGEYDIIFSDFVKVFPDKQEEVKTCIQGEIDKKDLPGIFMELQYHTGYFGYLWCKLLKKTFIEKSQAYFVPGLTLAEDLKFLVALYSNEPRCYFSCSKAYGYTVDANNSSKEKKIDYMAQLAVHYDIYQWIKNTAYLEKYEAELKKHISYYSAFVFFYGYENDQSLTQEVSWWKQNTRYKDELDSSRIEGVMKLLVICLKRDMITALKFILRVRGILRNLYRRVKAI